MVFYAKVLRTCDNLFIILEDISYIDIKHKIKYTQHYTRALL